MTRTLSQKGFSLVEVLIGASLIGGIALVAAQLFKQQNQALQYNRLVSELDTYHADLRRRLLDANNCNATFGSPNPNYNPGSNLGQIKTCCPNASSNPNCNLDRTSALGTGGACMNPPGPNGISIDAQNVRAIVDIGGGILKNKFVLSKYELYDGITNNVLPPNSGVSGGVDRLTVPVELRLTYELQVNIPGAKTFRRSIPLTFKYTQNGAFAGCEGETGSSKDTFIKEVCKGIHGPGTQISTAGKFVGWQKGSQAGYENCLIQNDPNPPTGASTAYCPTGQVLVGITSTGDKICQNGSVLLNGGVIINPTQATTCANSSVSLTLDLNGNVQVTCATTTPPTTPTTPSCSPSPACPSTYNGLALGAASTNISPWPYDATLTTYESSPTTTILSTTLIGCIYDLRASTSCSNYSSCSYTTFNGCQPPSTPTPSTPTTCPAGTTYNATTNSCQQSANYCCEGTGEIVSSCGYCSVPDPNFWIPCQSYLRTCGSSWAPLGGGGLVP